MARKSIMLIVSTLVIIETAAAMRNTGYDRRASCRSVQAVPMCAGLGYENTTFPNLRGHTTPEEANRELADFVALISTGCSNAIVHFLCSIYAPVCIQEYSDLEYPPCKKLCETVRDGCADTLLEEFGYSWPPGPHLDCKYYDTVQENQLCFGPSDPSILTIPITVTNHPPPQNLLATPLSPSTVNFTWDIPQESTNEVFILTCDPQPYEFPVSTTGSTVTSRHFVPDTEYLCRIFTAHTANMNNSTTVAFRTGKMGPPRNFAANILSPYRVHLSWSHPDERLPQMQQDQYMYNLICNSRNTNLQKSAKGSNFELDNLMENTEYSCNLSVLYANETAAIRFTTLETFKITFVHDTPSVSNNTVRVDFNINRPAKKISCRITGQSRKQDCSDYTATFQNIPKGSHRLQIVAENNREDKLNYKTKVYVSGTNSSSCAVNLINDRITYYTGNSVVIYFRGTNPNDRFECSLNKRATFRCYSPLFLRSLQQRNHQLKIIPASDRCMDIIPLSFHFNIQ